MTCATACLGCGEGHGHLTVCGPGPGISLRLVCPFHSVEETAQLFARDLWYPPLLVYSCRALWDAEEGWEPPRCAVPWCRYTGRWLSEVGEARCGVHLRGADRVARVRFHRAAVPLAALRAAVRSEHQKAWLEEDLTRLYLDPQ